jgi:hypothetical protein
VASPGRIKSYELQRAIARGGMATVYLAVDTRSGREVALKQMLPQVAGDPEFLSRFRHEVQIHASLHHPNILEVYELEAGPEHYFIAMELAEGGSLRTLLDRHPGGMLTEVALIVAAEVLKGLECAHASGIIHRDIKPHNILLTRAGAIKVADFGISKTDQMTRLTQTGDLIGTPAYMSPEQASARPLDARTDIFSVGVMLYEMLTGINPFNTGNPVTTLRMVTDHEPTPLSEADPRIPVACELQVERMLAKDPERRFRSAADAAAALESLVRQLGVADPGAVFRRYLQDPPGLTRDVRRRQAASHLRMGKSLLASGQASGEVILWELYQASLLDPENAEAVRLTGEQVGRTGYSLEVGPPLQKAEELLGRLRADPDNVSVLLQLAKLHKMQRSFPRLMRYFFRLRSLRVGDSYQQGQVAALVARPGAESRPEPAGATARSRESLSTSTPEGRSSGRPVRPGPAPGGEVTHRLPEPGEGGARPPLSPPGPAAPGVMPARSLQEPQRPGVAAHSPPPVTLSPPESQGAWARMSLSFKLGFALAALLVLAGLVKLLLGQ